MDLAWAVPWDPFREADALRGLLREVLLSARTFFPPSLSSFSSPSFLLFLYDPVPGPMSGIEYRAGRGQPPGL